ncbi:hypothetical protein FA13DRAFT_29343 [Coprinellus micaceus]|uniref:Uncharacterized protein n=1 Tax=Coprinellus micaceus TaxID=71717 RepID=A0A4Y7U039_COPMI|nr:hypothetical protein FA13DRAFT_29343 [Coprinellus micaceus]
MVRTTRNSQHTAAHAIPPSASSPGSLYNFSTNPIPFPSLDAIDDLVAQHQDRIKARSIPSPHCPSSQHTPGLEDDSQCSHSPSSARQRRQQQQKSSTRSLQTPSYQEQGQAPCLGRLDGASPTRTNRRARR